MFGSTAPINKYNIQSESLSFRSYGLFKSRIEGNVNVDGSR
jgi:hypothetical protein